MSIDKPKSPRSPESDAEKMLPRIRKFLRDTMAGSVRSQPSASHVHMTRAWAIALLIEGREALKTTMPEANVVAIMAQVATEAEKKPTAARPTEAPLN